MAWLRKASPSGGKPIDQGYLARAGRAIAGQFNQWFGPELPQPTSSPVGTAPRTQDYPVAYNINIQPRNLEAVSFDQLRMLADSFDLIRLCIETRKDQFAKMKWQFSVKRDPQESTTKLKARNASDKRLAELTAFFASPDKDHTWQEWTRMLLEELLVIDAPSIAPIADANGTLWTPGKQIFGLEIIDGSTVTRKIDINGRTPQPPDVAYQQIIKGIPSVDFTKDQLLYKPRNIRTHKFFGFSPVEQIMLTINIGLRREIHLLNYYTEGNIPEAIAQVPATWSSDQIQEFQEWFDGKLAGNSAMKRRITFVPESGTVQFTRDPKLKDELDEWLARIICYAFSLSPQAFIKAMNRATAETSVEQAASEGLTPLLIWFEDLINQIVLKYFDYQDIEFKFLDEKDENPVEQATIAKTYVDAGLMNRNEVREKLGEEPFPGGERFTITTASGIVPVENAIANSDNPPEPPPVQQMGPDGKPIDGKQPPGKNPPPDKKPVKVYRGYEKNNSSSRN